MADVKFSELTALAAADVDSADVLAIVDTSAALSKKITIDSLFGAVPVNIAVENTADASSTVTGSIQTDGGVGVGKSVFIGEDLTVTGTPNFQGTDVVFDSDGAATVTVRATADSASGVVTIPAGAGNSFVLTTTTQTMENKTLTSPVLNTGVSGTAILDEDDLNTDSDTQLATQQSIKAYVDSGTVTMTNKTLTAPIIADGGYISDSNSNELLQFETTTSAVNHVFIQNATTGNKAVIGSVEADTGLTFMNDPTQNEEMLILSPTADAVNEVTIASAATGSGASISSTGDDDNIDLLLVAKGTGVVKADGLEVTTISGTQTLTDKTLTSPVLTTPTITTSLQASTDSTDVVLNQFDGNEVARIFDGGATLSGGDTDEATGVHGGFGFRRPVLSIDASAGAKAVTLTDAESGALIKVDVSGTTSATVTLPAVGAGSEGVFYDFLIPSDSGGTGGDLIIATAATDSTIQAFVSTNSAGSVTQTYSAGGDQLTIGSGDITAGSWVRCTAVVGSATTSEVVWTAQVWQTGGTASTSV